MTRIALAGAYSDPSTIIQELDSYPAMINAVKQNVLKTLGKITPEFENLMKLIDVQVEAAKLSTLAEMGLSTEFENRIESLASQETDINNRAFLYLLGFRLNHRQQDFERSLRYLNLALELERNSSDKLSPVYKYVIRTAQLRQRTAQGTVLGPNQLIQEFQRAWSELQSYQPYVNVNDDIAWYSGRIATRFWIDELTHLGPDSTQPVMQIMNQVTQWSAAYQNEFLAAGFGPEDMIYHPAELQGFMTISLSCYDIIIACLESQSPFFTPDMLKRAPAAYKELRSQLEISNTLAQGLPLNLQHPGFPNFDLSDTSHVREMTTRLRYLEALSSLKPVEQQVAELQAVLNLLAQFDVPASYVKYHLEIGKQFKRRKRGDLAITAWERALQRADETGITSASIEASSLLAHEFGARNDWQSAGKFAHVANQNAQEQVGTQEIQSLSNLEVKAHIKADNPEQALAALTQGQQLKSADAQLKSNKEAAAAKAKLQGKKKQVSVLQQKVKQLEKMPASGTRDELLKKTQTLLAESKSEFLLQSRNLRQKFSRLYTTALRFDPLNLPDIQKALPADVAVVQYFSTADELYVFVVTPTTFRLRAVPIKKSSLDKQIFSFVDSIKRPGANTAKLDALGKNLYKNLVSPIEQDIAQSSTLVLIPSGRLNILPFAALTDASGQAFIEKKTLLELAKATDFMKISQSQPQPIQSIVAFANATLDLPAAEQEGQTIAELFPQSKLFKREEASKANLMKFGSQAQVLHLATHGTWDATDSLKNHLKLSNREQLGQSEIFNLNLEGTSIVTLSACSTALADKQEVGYVASLAEAFWIAGSRTVVASLWKVQDDSTALLMTEFYKELKAGKGKAGSSTNGPTEVASKSPLQSPSPLVRIPCSSEIIVEDSPSKSGLRSLDLRPRNRRFTGIGGVVAY